MRGRKGRAEKWNINEKAHWLLRTFLWSLGLGSISTSRETHRKKNVLEVFTWSMEFRNIYPIGRFLLPPFHFTVSQEMHHREIFCLGRILLGLASSNKIQSRKRSSIAPLLGLEDNQQWKEHLLQDLQARATAEYWKEQQLDLHVCLLEIWQQLNRS